MFMAVTPAALAASTAKRDREQPLRLALQRREYAARALLEHPLNSVTYYRRYVEGVERLVAGLLADEATLPAFEGTAFMRELYAEYPTLFGRRGAPPREG